MPKGPEIHAEHRDTPVSGRHAVYSSQYHDDCQPVFLRGMSTDTRARNVDTLLLSGATNVRGVDSVADYSYSRATPSLDVVYAPELTNIPQSPVMTSSSKSIEEIAMRAAKVVAPLKRKSLVQDEGGKRLKYEQQQFNSSQSQRRVVTAQHKDMVLCVGNSAVRGESLSTPTAPRIALAQAAQCSKSLTRHVSYTSKNASITQQASVSNVPLIDTKYIRFQTPVTYSPTFPVITMSSSAVRENPILYNSQATDIIRPPNMVLSYAPRTLLRSQAHVITPQPILHSQLVRGASQTVRYTTTSRLSHVNMQHTKQTHTLPVRPQAIAPQVYVTVASVPVVMMSSESFNLSESNSMLQASNTVSSHKPDTSVDKFRIMEVNLDNLQSPKVIQSTETPESLRLTSKQAEKLLVDAEDSHAHNASPQVSRAQTTEHKQEGAQTLGAEWFSDSDVPFRMSESLSAQSDSANRCHDEKTSKNTSRSIQQIPAGSEMAARILNIAQDILTKQSTQNAHLAFMPVESGVQSTLDSVCIMKYAHRPAGLPLKRAKHALVISLGADERLVQAFNDVDCSLKSVTIDSNEQETSASQSASCQHNVEMPNLQKETELDDLSDSQTPVSQDMQSLQAQNDIATNNDLLLEQHDIKQEDCSDEHSELAQGTEVQQNVCELDTQNIKQECDNDSENNECDNDSENNYTDDTIKDVSEQSANTVPEQINNEKFGEQLNDAVASATDDHTDDANANTRTQADEDSVGSYNDSMSLSSKTSEDIQDDLYPTQSKETQVHDTQLLQPKVSHAFRTSAARSIAANCVPTNIRHVSVAFMGDKIQVLFPGMKCGNEKTCVACQKIDKYYKDNPQATVTWLDKLESQLLPGDDICFKITAISEFYNEAVKSRCTVAHDKYLLMAKQSLLHDEEAIEKRNEVAKATRAHHKENMKDIQDRVRPYSTSVQDGLQRQMDFCI